MVLTDLKHTHTCEKCSQEYTHTHKATTADHKQYAFQCPNTACEWFIEKGKSKKVPTEGYTPKAAEKKDPRVTPVPEKDVSGVSESALQKAVRHAFAKGNIQCDNFRHFVLKHDEGEQYPRPVPKEVRHLLEEMVPYVDATCVCQRRALAEGVALNYHGMSQTEYVCFGAMSKGAGKFTPGMPAKKVFPLSYSLSEAALNGLKAQFPDWLFITTIAQGHDHPFAHTSTAVNAWNLMESLPKGTKEQPTQVLDLYGNPGSNEAFNKRQSRVHVTTNCFAWSTKDEGRAATKWGKTTRPDGTRRYYKADLRSMEGLDEAAPDAPSLKSFDAVVSVHALYHFTPDELTRLVNILDDGVPIHAIMHKFEAGSKAGTINCGEQKWERYEKHGQRYITQTNVATGESYSHPDNSWLFEANRWSHSANESATSPDGSFEVIASNGRCMGWTTNKCADDTYRFTFYKVSAAAYNRDSECGAPTTVGTRFVPVVQDKKNKRKAIKANGAVTVKHGGSVVEYKVPASAEPLFELARKNIMLTPRTPARFKSHTAWVKRQTSGAMASQAGKECPADALQDVIIGSFWCDVESELEKGAEAWVAKMKDSIRSDKLLDTGDMSGATDAVSKALSLTDALLSAKNTKDGVRKAIGSLRGFMASYA